MKRVRALRALGLFNEQDVALARQAELYADGLEDLAFMTAWVSQWTQSGHVCLALDTPFSELAGELELPDISIPTPKSWVEQIPANHTFVGDGSRRTPLVVDVATGALYLHRWYKAEQRVVAAIRDRMGGESLALTAPEQQRLDAHFPATEAAAQRAAVEIAMSGSFSIITGGPGTGKTTTLLKLIALFVMHHGADSKIALCAPTGKAVSRMDESIRGQMALTQDAWLRRIFSFEVWAPVSPPTTVHRLLGVNPVRGACRFNEHNKLPYDLIILDESSMMDLLLMNQLMLALRPETHLVLVGDKDQLPAVGCGTVFADLCCADSLSERVAVLDKNWRAKEAPTIVELAAAVNHSRCSDLFGLLNQNPAEVEWIKPEGDLQHVLIEKALPHWQQLKRCRTPKDAFEQLMSFQLLCAVRKGEYGVWAANEQAKRLLGEMSTHYHGLPIMITKNESQLKLYNGDVGVVLEDDEGKLGAWFPVAEGYRSIDLSRLPVHEPVYAMTIHKSQGSEAQQIMLILPEQQSPVLTRELLYTGITRAKKNVTLMGSKDVLEYCVARTVSRVSGISARLRKGLLS
jgi:exodeoxyribonuclease V alpha subunit